MTLNGFYHKVRKIQKMEENFHKKIKMQSGLHRTLNERIPDMDGFYQKTQKLGEKLHKIKMQSGSHLYLKERIPDMDKFYLKTQKLDEKLHKIKMLNGLHLYLKDQGDMGDLQTMEG
ncbi:uncharacterized protein LOC103522278 isoform X3 [Diaphorina citri]|uniref:Uncharacterized protein LOC103522278 isoform X1 n=1 Tax=Diaphorina citri TaxID=121845 RepID=A0A1S4EQM5_DIACI|nr:uncharacterized protein LOC103522278 isoform X1 [Diaphorina citri]XP_017304481.1 uncharacterized protein LOC103522278 isoform X2 [Diaphorina citri]XP_017304482.1 uncharacterized protein LOC103522278 isoform X3 [Diaphorina citri]